MHRRTILYRIAAALFGTTIAGAVAHADFATGAGAFAAGNYAGAYLALLPEGQAGNAQAQFLLGRMSDNGLGPVALDPREACRWYARAAEGGHAEAQFTLAQAYAIGRGVKLDADAALLWLGRSADAGHAPAMLALAELHDEGRGVKQDRARATRLIRKAADAGDAEAQYRYAERVLAGLPGADTGDAWAWFQRAAEGGHAAALYRLGRVGAGASAADLIAAYAWLTLAEQRGTGEVKAQAARERGELATLMTPADVAAASERVRKWKPKAEKLGGRH